MSREKTRWFATTINPGEPDLDNSNQKQLIQKTSHISQKLGLDLGYTYTWAWGPHSSSLIVDLYMTRNTPVTYQPTKKEKEIMAELQAAGGLLSSFPQYNSRYDTYELLSTVFWAGLDRGMTGENRIVEYCLNMKPWFTKKHVQTLLEYAKKWIRPKT